MIRLSQVKKVSPIFLSLLLCLSTLGIIIPYVRATAVIAVDPITSVADPPDSFSINITITGAEDLFSYEVFVGFDKTVLTGEIVEEGPFIRDGTASPYGTYFEYRIEDDYVYATCVTLGLGSDWGGVWGDGVLFTITFRVKAAGESDLHIYGVTLLDSTAAEILDFSTSDGDFHTTLPVASFTFEPTTLSRPIVGENVTFDASDSYDPDGGTIVSYFWDFNDTTTGTGQTVKHIYNEASTPIKPYNVTLMVIDDEGQRTNKSRTMHIKLHDIAIVDITGPEEIFAREIAQFNVTVVNKGSHSDSFNTTLYYNSKPIATNSSIEMLPDTNQTLIFYWNTFISQTTMIPHGNGTATWSYPLNVTDSDDLYAYSNVNLAVQELTGYNATMTGWTGISRVEIGIEAKTEATGDDQISVQVWTGKAWTPEYVRNITSTTDTFFWIDVTGTLSWEPGMVSEGRIRARMKYIQVGGEATPIYVDWLPIRITPRNPTDIPTGTYAIWANAFLVDQVSLAFRPIFEESNMTDNTLWGKPIVVTIVPSHDISVTIENVDPTQVAVGRTSTVTAKIDNMGNMDEIIDILVYNNGTLVASQTGVRLRAGLFRRFSFAWFTATNTTVEGDYNVTVYVPPVVGEVDTANNMQDVMVLMKLLPAPYFTFTPASPAIDEDVQFDASDSYVPGTPSGYITDYLWNFGDNTTDTGLTVTHAYAQPGSWSVKLTVIDDENLNNTITRTVQVPKLVSTITIAGSLTTVPLSLNTTISGSITPIRANVNVKINCTKIDEDIWTTVANLTSNQQGQYSFVWVPDTVGQYQFKAFWLGDNTTLAAESSLLNVTVILRDLAIVKLDLSRIWVTPGESLQIDVTASNKGTAQESFNINVYYNDTLLEAKPVADLVVSASKKVSFTWDTTNIAEGVYFIKATAGPLEGETYTADNSLVSGCAVQKAAVVSGAADIFMYTTIALAVVIVAMAIYLFRMMRSKTKPD